MRKITITMILALASMPMALGEVGASTKLFGRRRSRIKGHIRLRIKTAHRVDKLKLFLGHKRAAVRREAILRVGQIGTPKDIPTLVQVFNDEGNRVDPHLSHGVRTAVVQALRRIGGPKACVAISEILQDTLANGATELDLRDDPKYSHAAMKIIVRAIETLPDFIGSPGIRRLLSEIATEQKPPRGWYIAMLAKRALIQLDLKALAGQNIQQRLEYLVSLIPSRTGASRLDWVRAGIKTEEALITEAVDDILSQEGPEALPYLMYYRSKAVKGSLLWRVLGPVINQIKVRQETKQKNKNSDVLGTPSIRHSIAH